MSVQRRVETQERLLVSLAEELKLPLLQIAQEAEHAQSDSLSNIQATTQHALQLIDSLLLAQSVKQQQLELEQVAVSAVLYDAARSLHGLAEQYDCSLQLDVAGKFMPVMANRQLLQSALVGMGGAMITALQNENRVHRRIYLTAYKTAHGITAGCYGEVEGLSEPLLAKGRRLFGTSRQPMKDFAAQPSAGIFIADALLEAMQSQLKTSKKQGQSGLVATLQPSSQLTIV